jgi:PleD family two-component response regulator
MPVMMTQSKQPSNRPRADPSILLASDSERHGKMMHRALQQQGMAIEYAGDYSQVDDLLGARNYDVVLLEVTGEHAAEQAVAAALRVKRANAKQFVGYLADASLKSSGLAGDAVYPRNPVKVEEAVRKFNEL